MMWRAGQCINHTNIDRNKEPPINTYKKQKWGEEDIIFKFLNFAKEQPWAVGGGRGEEYTEWGRGDIQRSVLTGLNKFLSNSLS